MEDVDYDEDAESKDQTSKKTKTFIATILNRNRMDISCENFILPLPPNNDFAMKHKDLFSKPGMPVLALFPGTTCMYPSTVYSSPSVKKKIRDYQVKFENDVDEFGVKDPPRPVEPKFVIPRP